MKSILDFCDRCIWIEKGKIMGDGPSLPISEKYISYMKEERNYQTLNEQDRATVNAEIARKENKN